MSSASASVKTDSDRLLKYKTFAAAFTYPGDNFFALWPEFASDRTACWKEYDRIFRANEIWLYGSEHLIRNEFQRSRMLADIMGFYRAFNVEPENDRPDALNSELEFMHYLIFKQQHTLKGEPDAKAKKNEAICLTAQKKFFNEHLYPAAQKITEKIIDQSESDFYIRVSKELVKFLEEEKKIFKTDK